MAKNIHLIEQTQPPALPLAVPLYDKAYQDQLNNVLRIYFTRTSNALNKVTGTAGAQFIDAPNMLAYSTNDQLCPAADTAYAVDLGQTYLESGVSLIGGGTTIYANVGGVYNINFGGQIESTNSSSKTVYVWLNWNSFDIAYSTRRYTISGNGTNLPIDWNFNINLAEGDQLKVYFACSDTNVRFAAHTATAFCPASPATVTAVSYVSALPEVEPTPP